MVAMLCYQERELEKMWLSQRNVLLFFSCGKEKLKYASRIDEGQSRALGPLRGVCSAPLGNEDLLWGITVVQQPNFNGASSISLGCVAALASRYAYPAPGVIVSQAPPASRVAWLKKSPTPTCMLQVPKLQISHWIEVRRGRRYNRHTIPLLRTAMP